MPPKDFKLYSKVGVVGVTESREGARVRLLAEVRSVTRRVCHTVTSVQLTVKRTSKYSPGDKITGKRASKPLHEQHYVDKGYIDDICKAIVAFSENHSSSDNISGNGLIRSITSCCQAPSMIRQRVLVNCGASTSSGLGGRSPRRTRPMTLKVFNIVSNGNLPE